MKRYDIFYPVPQCSARMEENGDGDYVLWDDVKHLVAPAQQATNSESTPCCESCGSSVNVTSICAKCQHISEM